jgi:hypothetical protein
VAPDGPERFHSIAVSSLLQCAEIRNAWVWVFTHPWITPPALPDVDVPAALAITVAVKVPRAKAITIATDDPRNHRICASLDHPEVGQI